MMVSFRRPGRLLVEARGFASPPHDGFAFIVDDRLMPKESGKVRITEHNASCLALIFSFWVVLHLSVYVAQKAEKYTLNIAKVPRFGGCA
jgi:hypothetical protein